MTRAKSNRKINSGRRGKDAALSVRSATAAPAATADDVQHRDITTRSVSVRTGSFDEASRSFEAVLTTENPVQVFDWQQWRTVDEVLLADGGTWPARMPMLDSHNRYSIEDVMGSMVVAERTGGDTVVKATFAQGDERADKAMLKVRDKHITDVSLGYRVIKFTDIPAGQSGVVNDRTFTAGAERALRVTTQWEAVEGSLVPIGADRAAKIRKEPSRVVAARQEFPKMNPKLRAYLESIGLRAEATDAEAWAFMSTATAEQQRHASTLFTPSGEAAATGAQSAATTAAQRQSTTTPAANGTTPPADADAIRAEATRLERERQSGIRSLASASTPAAVIERCIAENLTVERAAVLILEAERAATPGAVNGNINVNTGAGRGNANEQLQVLSASLALRAGLRGTRLPTPRGLTPEQQRAHRERVGNMAAELGDVSLLDIMRESLALEGRSVGPGRSAVFEAARAASTGGLSNVFTTSMNAVLLQAYEEAADTAAAWTNQVEVADFKANDRILPSKGGGLKKLGRGGTAKDLAYGDTKESYRVARYAGKLTADEQDVIDDNIGFLQTVTRDMGLAAAELRPRLVYAILLRNAALDADSVTLFHSSHSNTATNALATSGSLAAAIIGMAKQTQDGRVLNLMPKFLLVPQDLFETAMNQLESPTIVLSGNTDVRAGVKNVLANFGITPIMDARLGVAGVTDPSNETAYAGSATNWFLAADPVQGKTIEVGVLRGTGGRPQVRSYVLSQGQWGMGWDVNLDIGAKALDYRGLYRGNT